MIVSNLLDPEHRPARTHALPERPHHHSRRPHPQSQGHRRRHPAQRPHRRLRRLRLRQVLARLRHRLRGRPAPLRRKPLRLRPPVPRAHREARRRPHGRPRPRHRHQAEKSDPQPPLHRRHRHRNLRLPPPALRPLRHRHLPALRRHRQARHRRRNRLRPRSPCPNPPAPTPSSPSSAPRSNSSPSRPPPPSPSPHPSPPSPAKKSAKSAAKSIPTTNIAALNLTDTLKERLLELRRRGYNRLYQASSTAQEGRIVEFSTPESLLELDFSDYPIFVLADRLVSLPRHPQPHRRRHRDRLPRVRRNPVPDCPRRRRTRRPPPLQSAAFECTTCHRAYREPEPRLFSFNNPFGACPRCQGFGNTIDFDPNLIIPDRQVPVPRRRTPSPPGPLASTAACTAK